MVPPIEGWRKGAAAGDDPVYIAQQLGHEDARFTLNAHAKAVKRRAKLSGVA